MFCNKLLRCQKLSRIFIQPSSPLLSPPFKDHKCHGCFCCVFSQQFYVNRRGNQSHLGWDRPGSVFCPLSVNRWRCQRHRRGLGWAGISLPPFFHFFVSQPAGENVWIWSWYQLDCQPCHDRVRVINRKSFSRMDECNQTIQPLSTLSRSLVVCTAWLLLTGVCGVTSSICIFGQDQFSNPLK